MYLVFVAAWPAGLGRVDWWLRVRPLGDDPLPSLADRRAVASLTLAQVVAKAKRLRPSLAATPPH